MLQALSLFHHPSEGYPQHVHIPRIRVLRLSLNQVSGGSPGPESQAVVLEQLKRGLSASLTGGSNLESMKTSPTLAPDHAHIKLPLS